VTFCVDERGRVYKVLGNEVGSWVSGEYQTFAFTGRSGRAPSAAEHGEATRHAPFLVQSKDPWTHGNSVAARKRNRVAS
jgi:hypothetical protein